MCVYYTHNVYIIFGSCYSVTVPSVSAISPGKPGVTVTHPRVLQGVTVSRPLPKKAGLSPAFNVTPPWHSALFHPHWPISQPWLGCGMPPVVGGSAAPFLRYLANKSNYNPLPLGVRPLFYVQYGQWRSAYSKGYEQKKLSSLSTIHKVSVLRWREFLAYYEPAANWADRGLLFNPSGEWPSNWPDDWPPWVTPIHLLRAFGGSNRCAKYDYSQYLYKWTNRPGLPELFAYVYGVPLNRKEEALARRGARSLLQTPQFNIYAHNVDCNLWRRFDVTPLKQAQALHHLEVDPLATEDEQVALALPPWMWDPEALAARGGPFEPLRTRASDLLPLDAPLLGRNAAHVASQGEAKPKPERTNVIRTWAADREPMYLATKRYER